MSSLDELLRIDKNIDWDLFISRHQDYSPAFAYLIVASLIPQTWFSRSTGLKFAFTYFKRVGDEYYWSLSESQHLKEILDNKGKIDRHFYIKLIKKAELHCQDLTNWSLNIRKKDFSNKTNRQLGVLFKAYWQKLRNASAFMLVKHNLNRILEKRIQDKLSQLSASELFDKLLTPSKDTLIIQANKHLSKLALKTIISPRVIEKWLNMYGWIEMFTWIGKPLTRAEVNRKINKLKEERSAKKEKQKIISLKQQFKNNSSLLSEIEALQYLLYFHTYEIESLFASHYWCRGLLTEISSRIGIPFEDYPFAVYPEILNALRGVPINKKRILKRRNNQYAIYLIDEKVTLIEGKDFLRAKSNIFAKQIRQTELKGRTAFQGQVKGRAIIVKTVRDFVKVKSGGIIVSPMTTTDFTPYLKNVKAIVTDEGGVTCHAAIVAREFGIPCIVGTKVATKILKDGDLLEVDANNGVIRKLN